MDAILGVEDMSLYRNNIWTQVIIGIQYVSKAMKFKHYVWCVCSGQFWNYIQNMATFYGSHFSVSLGAINPRDLEYNMFTSHNKIPCDKKLTGNKYPSNLCSAWESTLVLFIHTHRQMMVWYDDVCNKVMDGVFSS